MSKRTAVAGSSSSSSSSSTSKRLKAESTATARVSKRVPAPSKPRVIDLEHDVSISIVSTIHSTSRRSSMIGSELLPLINGIHSVLYSVSSVSSLDMNLPEIVVIGSQSSGKSSVLEGLVGRDFLPRGTGMVTRRPLYLQLVHNNGNEEWGEFGHIKDKKFFDFDEIKAEIERETERHLQNKLFVSKDPIYLKIFSPNTINLTLVDTPGLVKNAIQDQPKDISDQIENIAYTFVKNPNSLILAVSPANNDLANSDALTLAKRVDPERKRTLGVLTKVDIVDKGAEQSVEDIINNRIIRLYHGFVPVKCRSQDDINNGKTIHQMLQDEEEFFKNKMYPQSSIKTLASKCSMLLNNHIRDSLPAIKKRIDQELQSCNSELSKFPPVQDLDNKRASLGITITEFVTALKNAYDGQLPDIHGADIKGGAKLGLLFHSTFAKTLKEINPILKENDDKYYENALLNAGGACPSSMFIAEKTFKQLVQQVITKLKPPCLDCLDNALDETTKIVKEIENRAFLLYPNLHQKVINTYLTILYECEQKTREKIEDIIDCELSYINTCHPEFIHAFLEESNKHKETNTSTQQSRSFWNWFSGSASDPCTKVKASQIALIKSLINAYFQITAKTIHDQVVKAIWHFLIERSLKDLELKMSLELNKPEVFGMIFNESTEYVQKRQKLMHQQEVLQKASKEIIQTMDKMLFLTSKIY